MPGPPPKNPATRARRNTKSTALELHENPDAEVPDLPNSPVWREGPDGEHLRDPRTWEPETQEAWEDLWRSPMAEAWIPTDHAGIRRYITLFDDFVKAETLEDRIRISTEMRMLGTDYGLTPKSRASLQWAIVQAEKALTSRPPRTPAIDSTAEDLGALTS